MSALQQTSMERVLTTLGHKEPDRVPLFLLVTMHGARELGLSIRDYFARAENVVEGQLRMRARYGHDCLYPLLYASLELEAFGGETLFRDDGPPNAGAPVIRRAEDITALEPPRVRDTRCLHRALEAIRQLKACVGNEVPIIGVVMSPFSLPVMQMGFEKYLDLLFERRDLWERLMAVNEAFCVEWANAQLEAGASAICYFDPVSSSMIVPREFYLETGHRVATRTLPRINGPTATHLASGFAMPVIGDVAATGTVLIGVSAQEDLAQLKAAAAGRIALLGNLNGIEMRRWTAADAETIVRQAIAKAGRGGGFILSDNHGEIPWQVAESTLDAIAAAVRMWGRYPLQES
jgi:uroporphyrinogen decarboxylase